jgi:nicotinic acetylcholine receptor
MDTKDMLTENRYDARVKYDGSVKINIPQYVTCICRLSIDRFPFGGLQFNFTNYMKFLDTQFCAIAQASPLLSTSEMNVNATQPPKDSYFAGNAEWFVLH